MLSLFPLTLGLPIFYMVGYCSSYALLPKYHLFRNAFLKPFYFRWSLILSLSTTVFIASILVIICCNIFIYLFTACLHQETVSSKKAEVHLSYLKFYTVSFTVPHNPRWSVKTDWLIKWKSTYFSVLCLNEATNTSQHFQELFHIQWCLIDTTDRDKGIEI